MTSIFPLAALMVFFLSGCSWRPHVVSQEKALDIVLTTLDASSLASGGKIAFTPFKAGPQAIDDEQLDHVSLVIIKGMVDRINQGKTSLSIAAGDELSNLIVQGYIEDFSQNGKFDRWVLRRDKGCLAISGEIWLPSSGAKAATFSGYARLNHYKDVSQAAEALGQALGDELLLHISKE